MAKITGGESALLSGVSQQPDDRRLRGSLQELVNTQTDVLGGLKRSPALWFDPVSIGANTYAEVAWRDFTLNGSYLLLRIQYTRDSSTELLIHVIDRFSQESEVVLDADTILYITSQDPEDIRITVTDDGVYILNPNVTTAMSAGFTLAPYGAYVNMTGSNYGRDYEIYIDDALVSSVNIPVDAAGLDASDIQSESIIQQLVLNWLDTDYLVASKGNTLYVTKTLDPFAYINIRVSDGDNGNYLQVAQGTVPSVDKLPSFAIQNSVLAVRPNNGGLESEYYLKYTHPREVDDHDLDGDPADNPELPVLDLDLVWKPWHTTGSDLAHQRGYITTVDGNNEKGALDITDGDFFGGTVTDCYVASPVDDGSINVLEKFVVRYKDVTDPIPETLIIVLFGKTITLVHTNGRYETSGLDFTYFRIYDSAKDANNQNTALSMSATLTPSTNVLFNGGVWVETVQPQIQYMINSSTMPVKLTFDSFDWACTQVHWHSRRVGNTENNKEPSFIGKQINDIAFIHSRLCFLTDVSAVFSRVDHETDFWRRSATTITDADRVDVESRLLTTGSFRSLTIHDKDIVVMGDAEQWVIRTTNGITPSSTVLQLASRYTNEADVTPVTLGSSIAYPVFDGRYTQLREFYTRDDTSSNDSEYLTAVVPKYIEGRVKQLVSNTLNNYLAVQTDKPNVLYIMQWHNQNGTRVMQSWHTWTLPGTPEHIYFARGYLILVMDDGVTMKRSLFDLSGGTTGVAGELIGESFGGLDFEVHLHFRFAFDISNNQITLPIDHPYNETDSLVIGASDSNYPGMSIPFTIAGDIVTIDDQLGTTLTGRWLIGNKYTTEITLPKILPRDQEDNVMSEATLRLNSLKLRHNKSGEYKVTVTRNWGDYFNEVIETELDMTRLVGAAMVDAPLLHTGELHVPIRERSEFTTVTISTDGHLPFNLTGYDWSGQISGSGQRRQF